MTEPAHPAVEASGRGLLRQHRQQRQHTVVMGLVSYVADFVMLMALSWAGALQASDACAYLAFTGLTCVFFYLLLSTSWSERFQDHYFTGPQMLVHAAIMLGFMVYVPQIGLLLLMCLFVLFAFSSFRVNLKRPFAGPLPAAVVVAVSVVVLMILTGQHLRLPAANWQQRVVSGVWVALILARCTVAGLYSAQLRALLAKRNSELADTFVKLEQMASHDELTGALNRRSLMLMLEEERQRMQRTGQTFGVALFDIDHFKQVNDSFGHLVGDEALRRFTHTASISMRNTDRLGRYGGEEFLMLLTATADETAARVAAERVREGILQHNWETVAPGLKITVSAGVALCRPGESAEHLLDRADQALYAAKHSGRNCVRVDS